MSELLQNEADGTMRCMACGEVVYDRAMAIVGAPAKVCACKRGEILIYDPNLKWEMRFLSMAKLISTWSKDPSTKCGAVITRPDRTIASLGYNGLPRGLEDRPDRYQDRDLKYGTVVHAEMNALLFAREPLVGYTVSIWPCISCERCCVHIIQSGIIRVIAPLPTDDMNKRWGESFIKSRANFVEAGVEVVEV